MSLDLRQTFSGFETLAKAEKAVVEGEEIAGSFSEATPLVIGEAIQACESFANCPNNPDAIARFTARFGPLFVPMSADRRFRFRVGEWGRAQAEFRNNWEQLSGLSSREQLSGLRGRADLTTSEPRRFQVVFPGPGKGFKLQVETVLDLLYLRLFSIPRERIRVCPVPACRKCFVALHLKQTYCGNNTCIEWGKKKLKLEYWNRNKKELLAKRKRERWLSQKEVRRGTHTSS